MGDDVRLERERLRRIGTRAFREVFEFGEDGPEQLEKALAVDRKDPVTAGFDWGLAVGRDAGVALVFRSAVKWKFDRHAADEVTSLFADVLDPECLLDVVAALARAEKPSDLRNAALARLAHAMNGPPPPAPDPVLRLRKAFRAAQQAPDPHGEPSADPTGDIPPGPCKEAYDGWILGILAGYRTGKDDGLGRIVASRASVVGAAG